MVRPYQELDRSVVFLPLPPLLGITLSGAIIYPPPREGFSIMFYPCLPLATRRRINKLLRGEIPRTCYERVRYFGFARELPGHETEWSQSYTLFRHASTLLSVRVSPTTASTPGRPQDGKRAETTDRAAAGGQELQRQNVPRGQRRHARDIIAFLTQIGFR